MVRSPTEDIPVEIYFTVRANAKLLRAHVLRAHVGLQLHVHAGLTLTIKPPPEGGYTQRRCPLCLSVCLLVCSSVGLFPDTIWALSPAAWLQPFSLAAATNGVPCVSSSVINSSSWNLWLRRGLTHDVHKHHNRATLDPTLCRIWKWKTTKNKTGAYQRHERVRVVIRWAQASSRHRRRSLWWCAAREMAPNRRKTSPPPPLYTDDTHHWIFSGFYPQPPYCLLITSPQETGEKWRPLRPIISEITDANFNFNLIVIRCSR